MAYEKAPLKLETKDVVLVKPSKSVPSCILSLSTIDNRDIFYGHCQTVHVYRSSSAVNDNDSIINFCHVFKEALSKALFYYYPFAGRVEKHVDDGKLRVNCNPSAENYGVPFLEAFANCTLSSVNYLDNIDTETSNHFVFGTQDKTYPLVFKVTKFLCGGFTIGMGAMHAVCDGVGASQFFKTIIEHAKGRSEPSMMPVWERDIKVGSISKQSFPQCSLDIESLAVSPFLDQDNTIKQYCFKVDCEMITNLKLSLMKESEKTRFTTFESITGYVWRSRARALKLNNNGETMLSMIVGIKRNSKDCDIIPKGYYGNSIVDANVVLKVSELNEKPLYETIKLIRESKNISSTTDYVKNSITALETNDKAGFDILNCGAVTLVTEWKHLGFLDGDLDFGENEVVNLVPASCNLFGSLAVNIFTSPNKIDDGDPAMKGGVLVFTSLPVVAMPKFKEEIEALRFLS